MTTVTSMQGEPPSGVSEPRALVERVFAAVAAKDIDAVLRCFADDGVLIDPHYPTIRMAGKPAIAEGLRWVFEVMNTLSFSVLLYFASDDGQRAAVEVDTNHVLRTGKRLHSPQVFIIETRDGLLTRIQAYEPYGPNGIGGVLLGLNHLWHRTASKRRSRANSR